jgi:hydrogenase nickel incorporation protein HypB
MCRTCGCGAPHAHGPFEPAGRHIALESSLLAKNDRLAAGVRARLARDRVAAVNLIGSPGAGKTTLLEHTIRALRGVPIAVIEGDQATDRDARRIAATGARVRQVNTDAGCHLDAAMIERAIAELDPAPRSLLAIENVGNLVCPALFDLGERVKVVVIALTEGEDKPLKYPHVFRAAQAMVLAKMDLAPHLDVDPSRYMDHARQINPALAVFPVAARTGEGMSEWCRWLCGQLGASA